MPLTGYPSLCGERQPIIVSRDRGQSREHRAQNPGSCRVSHYQIDGVVIRDSALRRDFLLMNDEKADAYLIELKGSDIEHALEQLEATARRLQSELRGYTVKYRLVHSRAKTQAIHSNAFKKFCRAHAKRANFCIRRAASQKSFDISARKRLPNLRQTLFISPPPETRF